MTNRHQLPGVFVPFALLTMFGPLPIMLLQHDQIHVQPAGLAVVAILLVTVARHSLISWSLLLLWNLLQVFMIGAVVLGGPGRMTLGAPLLFLLALSCAAMQLMPSMRHHVGPGHGWHTGAGT